MEEKRRIVFSDEELICFERVYKREPESPLFFFEPALPALRLRLPTKQESWSLEGKILGEQATLPF